MKLELNGDDFSFKKLFVPMTTFKALHWIVILGFVVFFNSLFNGFAWDDYDYILNNSEVHSFNLLKIVSQSMFNDPSPSYYRPIPALYFTLLYLVFKNLAFFYHILQLLLHIINALLVFIFFKKFYNKYLSLFLSLLFLIHPIQVESVVYIAQTVSPLFFLFGIIALLLSQEEDIGIRRIILVNCLLLLAILTKETGVLFLFVVLLYRVIFTNKKRFIFFIFGFIITAVYLLVRFNIGRIFFDDTKLWAPFKGLTIYEKLINIPTIIAYYLKTFFAPLQLVINQKWVITTIDIPNFYLPLLFLIAFLFIISMIGLILFRKNKKYFTIYSFFLLWFLSGLAMHLQIFPLDMTVADRWFYFPIVGLLGIIGASINTLHHIKKSLKTIALIGVVIILIILSIRTIIRTSDWYDPMTLYAHDLEVYFSSDIANNLGREYIDLHNYRKAYDYINKSVLVSPNEVNLSNLGVVYQKLGNLEKAKEYFIKSIAAHALPEQAHRVAIIGSSINLSYIYLLQNENETAKIIIKKLLVSYPTNGYLWEYLAVSEYRLHHEEEAILALKKSKTYLPNVVQNDEVYLQIMNRQPIRLTP